MPAREPIARFLRLPALPDESAADYLLRLFEIEGRPWNITTFHYLDIPLPELLMGDHKTHLRRFTDIDFTCFEETTPVTRSDNEVLLGSEVIRSLDWLTTPRRWCPDCFRSDLRDETLSSRYPDWRIHRRWWWNIRQIKGCPTHRAKLETRCPTCRTLVTWQAGSLTTCANGHSLLTHPPTAIDEENHTADKWFLARIGGAESSRIPVLDGANLAESIRVLERVGTVSIKGVRGTPPKNFEYAGPSSIEAGIRALEDFPNSFMIMLDRLVASRDPNDKNWGAPAIYGNLILWFKKESEKPWYKTLLDTVWSHHAANNYTRRDSAAAGFAPFGRPISLSDAADRLKKSPEVTKKYLLAMDNIPNETQKGTPIVVSSVDVIRLERLFEDSITIDDVQDILDVPRSTVKRLVAAGIVPTNEIHSKAGVTNARYTRKELTNWLDGLTKSVKVFDTVPPTLKPITTAGKGRTFGGLVGALEIILNDGVPAGGRLSTARGLNAVLVDPENFDRIHLGIGSNEMTIREASEYSDFHEETIWAAVHDGFLGARTVDGKRVVVDRKKLDIFIEDMITLGEFAWTSGTSTRSASAELQSAGIQPVLSTKNNKRARSTFYLKESLDGKK